MSSLFIINEIKATFNQTCLVWWHNLLTYIFLLDILSKKFRVRIIWKAIQYRMLFLCLLILYDLVDNFWILKDKKCHLNLYRVRWPNQVNIDELMLISILLKGLLQRHVCWSWNQSKIQIHGIREVMFLHNVTFRHQNIRAINKYLPNNSKMRDEL